MHGIAIVQCLYNSIMEVVRQRAKLKHALRSIIINDLSHDINPTTFRVRLILSENISSIEESAISNGMEIDANGSSMSIHQLHKYLPGRSQRKPQIIRVDGVECILVI